MTAAVWQLDIADSDWVGPIDTTALMNGFPVPITSGVQFAVTSARRPADADWQPPVLDPGGSGKYGVSIAPVTGLQTQGIWARYVVGDRAVYLGPAEVGSIKRTTR